MAEQGKFPYFLDSRHDELIKEVLGSKARITLLTAPRRFGVTHMAIKMSLMKQLDCKVAETCFIAASPVRESWVSSRLSLAQQNFSELKQRNTTFYLTDITVGYDLVIVDDIDQVSIDLINKLCSSSRVVFMGIGWEVMPQCFKSLEEQIQRIECQSDSEGNTSHTTRYVTGKEL